MNISTAKADEAAVFSFNASGWLYVFQIGVVAMLQEATDLGNVQVHGTSAGAAAAAAIALDFPGQLAAEEMCQQESRSRVDFKAMVPLMKEGLERLTPLDAAARVNGRLGIVCTELRSSCPLHFETIEFRQFSCREDVVELLSATAHVPVLGGYLPHTYKGRRLYDGLFTDTHPLSEDRTCFKVSWTPQCDCGCTKDAASNPRLFAPRVRMPLRWCVLPPDETTLRLIFWHGYCQARAVLKRSDFPRHVLPLKPGALEACAGEGGGWVAPVTLPSLGALHAPAVVLVHFTAVHTGRLGQHAGVAVRTTPYALTRSNAGAGATIQHSAMLALTWVHTALLTALPRPAALTLACAGVTGQHTPMLALSTTVLGAEKVHHHSGRATRLRVVPLHTCALDILRHHRASRSSVDGTAMAQPETKVLLRTTLNHLFESSHAGRTPRLTTRDTACALTCSERMRQALRPRVGVVVGVS